MDEPTPESSADATEVPVEAPAERKRRRWLLPVSLVPVVLLVVLVVAWVVDTSAGGVARNVQLAGQDVGRLGEAELSTRVEALADGFAATPVELVVTPGTAEDGSDADEPDTYTTTAGEIGLMIDQARTVRDALDLGTDGFVLLRPFAWVGSFLSEREAPVRFRVSSDKVEQAVIALEGDHRRPPTEPTVELVDGVFQVVPGAAGRGVDPADVVAALPGAAAGHADGTSPIRVEVERTSIAPLGADADAERAAAGLESLVEDPVTITTSEGDRTIAPEVLRTWATLTTAPDGTVGVDLDPARVDAGLKAAFQGLANGPKDARFTIQDGKPVILPEAPGRICCGPDAAATIMSSLRAGSRTVELQLTEGLPSFTAAEAAKLGIVEEIGSPTEFGPTTQHKCCESRVQNIHRIADLIRGVVIQPGRTFSVNDHVGRRTRAGGFAEGGAIIDGQLTTSIGGGISQFATTLFNASLYAGLDFGEYQSHSLYISRYPRGREATLSYPHPDLQIKNTTPYGVLIWPTYTDTSITVHLYSTKHASVTLGATYDVPAGNCTKVVTPRTRTYPDGRVVNDTVFARYRPAEGVNC